jgi:hypothetical protein
MRELGGERREGVRREGRWLRYDREGEEEKRGECMLLV